MASLGDFGVIGRSVAGETAKAGAGGWRRVVPSLPMIAGLAALARALAEPRALLNDPDTYLHIAAGRWIIAHAALPVHDPFSHTFAGALWVPHEWLAEAVLAAVYRGAGWSGVVLLAATCFALSVALLTRYLLRWAEPFTALIAAGLGAALVEGHVLARPHMLAMPLLVWWSGALFAARDSGAPPPYRLLPVMVLWANLHASFLAGVGLALFLFAEAIATPERGRWGRFAAFAAAAAMLTPNGVAGFTAPLRLMAMPALQASFGEWQSADFQHFQPLEIWLLGLLGLGLGTGVKAPLSRVALVALLCHMALAHIRHADLVGLVGPLALAASLGPQLAARLRSEPVSAVTRLLERRARPAAAPAAILTLAVAVAMSLPLLLRPLERGDGPVTPASALAAAQALGLDGPVLNSERFGGYLVYQGVPTFIDGRIELYGNAFLTRFIAAAGGNAAALAALLDRYRIQWTLLAPEEGAVPVLDRLPGWRRVYSDAHAVIHTRAPVAGRSAALDAARPERVDLGIFGEPPELLFRKRQAPVDGDLEHPGDPFDQLDLGAVFFYQSRPRTEGPRLVVSRHAVFDPDLHRAAPAQTSASAD